MLNGHKYRAYGKNLQPFTGNGDVSKCVKNSRVGQKLETNKQNKTNKHILSVQGCNLMTICSAHTYYEQGRPVTLTPVAERLAAEMSLPVLTTQVCRSSDSNAKPSACEANALTDCTIAAAQYLLFVCCKCNVSVLGMNTSNMIRKTKTSICIFQQ